MNCSVKFILLVLSIIVHLVLFVNLFPDLCEKFVIGSLVLIARVIVGTDENDARDNDDAHWSTAFGVFLTACTAITAVTLTVAVLCAVLKNHTRAQYVLYACVVASCFFDTAVCFYVHYNLIRGPRDAIDDWLGASVRDYKKPDCGYTRIVWDYLQTTFKCCGYRSPDDWTRPGEFDVTEYGRNYVPESCCIKPYPCGAGSYDNRTSYWVGCGQKILHITVVAEIVGWAFGVLAISKITALLLTHCYITYTEKTSLVLPVTGVYKIDNKKRHFRKHQNTTDSLRADVIRSSVRNK